MLYTLSITLVVLVLATAVLVLITGGDNRASFDLRATALGFALCAVGCHIAGFLPVVAVVLAGISIVFVIMALDLGF